MDENVFLDIKIFLEKEFGKIDVPKFASELDKKIYILKYEKKLFRKLSNYLIFKYGDFYNYRNTILLMKLSNIFPNGLPDKLYRFSLDIVFIISNIFESEKRDFYINFISYFSLSFEKLNYYLENNLYEKILYMCKEYQVNYDYSNREFILLLQNVMETVELIY